MAEEFRGEMAKLGGTSIGMEIIDTKTIFDMRPIMTKFKNQNPDVIFIVGYPEPLGTMVSHAREIGYQGHFVTNNTFNARALQIAGLKNSVGTLVQTMYWDYCIANPEADRTGAVNYLANLYKAKYPGVTMTDIVAVTWDLAMTYFRAMELAGTFTDTLAICKSFDKAVKSLADKLTIPHDGVLPSGMITGVIELVTEVQPDGSRKKVGEIVYSTEKLR
jgi:ABC-type branched-subunit amino acid transport system substrate-binding protein